MEPISFRLVPFESTRQTKALSLRGEVARAGHQLSIRYQLSGDLSCVELPSTRSEGQRSGGQRRDSRSGRRRQRLWEKTCFEFFLRPADSALSHYWEVNLSPGGDWNVFSLSNYRAGLKEEAAIAYLPFQTDLTSNELQLDLSMDLEPLVGSQNIQVGISTVLILDNQESYWAIAHPTPQADFHHPDSFTLLLPYRNPNPGDSV